jgi:hypothetical protein
MDAFHRLSQLLDGAITSASGRNGHHGHRRGRRGLVAVVEAAQARSRQAATLRVLYRGNVVQLQYGAEQGHSHLMQRRPELPRSLSLSFTCPQCPQ